MLHNISITAKCLHQARRTGGGWTALPRSRLMSNLRGRRPLIDTAMYQVATAGRDGWLTNLFPLVDRGRPNPIRWASPCRISFSLLTPRKPKSVLPPWRMSPELAANFPNPRSGRLPFADHSESRRVLSARTSRNRDATTATRRLVFASSQARA